MCSKSLRWILTKTWLINRWQKTRSHTRTLLRSWSDPNATKAGLLSDVHTGEQFASMLFWCSVPIRSLFWYQHSFLVWSDCIFIMNIANVKISLLNIGQIYWTSFISKDSQQIQKLNCVNFCSQAWYQIFSRQRRKSMGFAARKSKSVELTLTTEMVQDGMLFITNLLLKNLIGQ